MSHTLVGLLFHPGQLTAEFRDGQRMRAVAPWRVAFNTITLFFLLSIATGFKVTDIGQQDPGGRLATTITHAVERSQQPRELVVDRIERRFTTVYTACMALSTLSYMLLVGLTHRRARQPWLVHAVFALHLMACIFIGSTVMFVGLHALQATLGPDASTLSQLRTGTGLVLLLAILSYLLIAFRRVYGDRPWAAALKAMLVVSLGSVFDQLMFFLAFGLTLRSI